MPRTPSKPRAIPHSGLLAPALPNAAWHVLETPFLRELVSRLEKSVFEAVLRPRLREAPSNMLPLFYRETRLVPSGRVLPVDEGYCPRTGCMAVEPDTQVEILALVDPGRVPVTAPMAWGFPVGAVLVEGVTSLMAGPRATSENPHVIHQPAVPAARARGAKRGGVQFEKRRGGTR